MTDDPRHPAPADEAPADDGPVVPDTESDTVPDTESDTDTEADRRRAEELRRVVLHKSLRRERARHRRDESIWAWLGTFGLVGWTVSVPTLLGLALGRFIDDRVESTLSFTITFLVAGAAVGVSMAWYWVRRESQGDDDREPGPRKEER